jgi:hypothetical protein
MVSRVKLREPHVVLDGDLAEGRAAHSFTGCEAGPALLLEPCIRSQHTVAPVAGRRRALLCLAARGEFNYSWW